MADSIITEQIQLKLDEIERKENVRILHCVESGSRAWGFESPDSDYDVRFVYVREPEQYLRLDEARDVIEWEINDVYDINGWDLRKTLRLLYKSNPTLFEWNNSPLVYRTTDEWKKISSVIEKYFIPKSGIYHYISMAGRNNNQFIKDREEVKLKKYFYVLRPVLACKWIIDRGTPPPMLFSELMDAELDSSIRPDVEKLIDMKMNTPEFGMGSKIESINKYINKSITEIQRIAESMNNEIQPGWDELNSIFFEILGERKGI